MFRRDGAVTTGGCWWGWRGWVGAAPSAPTSVCKPVMLLAQWPAPEVPAPPAWPLKCGGGGAGMGMWKLKLMPVPLGLVCCRDWDCWGAWASGAAGCRPVCIDPKLAAVTVHHPLVCRCCELLSLSTCPHNRLCVKGPCKRTGASCG